MSISYTQVYMNERGAPQENKKDWVRTHKGNYQRDTTAKSLLKAALRTKFNEIRFPKLHQINLTVSFAS